MIDRKKISRLVDNYLKGDNKFLVEVRVRSGNHINVFLDGDQGVTISDCVDVSRHIESNLDRESEDFDLKVSSAGIDQPYKLKRQYKKNIGQMVKVTMIDGKEFKGKLVNVAGEEIIIEPKLKKKKKAGDGEVNELTLLFENIKETKGIVTFK